MKSSNLFLFLFLSLLFSANTSFSQEKILAGEAWEELTQKKFLADFFKDYFVNLGVEVRETGEQITVLHKGDHFKIVEGINEEEVDYILPIGTENILNLIKHANDGEVDAQETYQILAVLFTPMTAATLEDPVMSKRIPRWMSKFENNIHVTLFNPDRTESVSHTLIYLNREWIVVPGYHGTPKRVYELNTGQALLYQQKVSKLMESNNKKSWRQFKRWYMEWRKGVSVAN